MRAVAALLAAVPVLAFAQGGPVNAARGAAAQASAAGEARAAAADAAAAPEKSQASDGAVDLNAAAAQLEGEKPSRMETGDVLEVGGADSYTVVPGDTLWDLSAKFLQDPFSWPKIWSWNPQIANPHWIYPGNVLKLQAGEGGAAVAAPAATLGDDSDLAPPPAELGDFTRADLGKPMDHGEGDEVLVAAGKSIAQAPKRAGVLARPDAFVTRREIAQSGVIGAAFEDKAWLSIGDRTYARFQAQPAVKPGQTYVIYRTATEVRHPVTKKHFGYKTVMLGAARVVSVDDRAVTLDIVAAAGVIERGALLAPWPGNRREISPRANQRQVAGVIMAPEADDVRTIAEHHVVFIDKGAQDGVEEGNIFTAIRSGDPYGHDPYALRNDPRLPLEDVGVLVVVDAKDHASAALVVSSERELLIGDRVEMRVAGGAAAQGAGSN